MASSNTANRLGGQGTDGNAETIYDFFEGLKYLISETHFTNFLPDLFNRIHLRRIGRNKEQLNIRGDAKGSCFMPGSPITAQKYDVIWILF